MSVFIDYYTVIHLVTRTLFLFYQMINYVDAALSEEH